MSKHPGIYVDDMHSVRNFGMCYASKSVSPPPKQVVRKSIPYRNGSVDFTCINGEEYYGDREVVYVFDVIGDTPFEVTKKVEDFCAWLAPLSDVDIHDDEMPRHHWHGGCDSIDVDWNDDGYYAKITATFILYPFMIADNISKLTVKVGDNYVYNEGRPARLTVKPTGSTVTIQVGSVKQTFIGETVADLSIPSGYSTIKVTGGSAELYWREERL